MLITQDRAWLEKVVAEGVRDDFKVMTGIYSRLCAYLDHVATAPVPTPTPTAATAAVTEPLPPIGGVSSAGSPRLEPPLAPTAAGARQSAALSTFVATSAPPAAVAATVGVNGGEDGSGGGVAVAEEQMVEGVMNDLEVRATVMLAGCYGGACSSNQNP